MPDDNPAEEIAAARRRLAEIRTGASRAGGQVDRLADGGRVRGVGEAADGRVRAVAARGRLDSVELDPRLLRSSAAELGPLLAEAMNGALEDLRSKAPSAEDPVVDPAALARSLGEVQEQGMAQMASIQAALDEATVQIRARSAR